MPAPVRPAAPGTRPPLTPPGGSAADLVLLVVAVGGVSLSAPLIASTTAPALAIAFWRNAMATGVLAPAVLVRPGLRAELRGMGRRALGLSVLSGVFLAAHFGLWLPSLRMTSVASATALATTTPLWTLVVLRLRGERAPALVWTGAAVAFAGVVLLSGVDLSLSSRALLGDVIALGGGMAAAGYVLLGASVRRTVSTTSYTLVCYATAAGLLAAACAVAGAGLGGYPAEVWLKLAALTVSAQFLGHSLLNRVVRGLGAAITSTAMLLEAPGAALIAALWLGQQPPAGVYAALAVIVTGLALVVWSTTRR